jgi:hypothetical protein
MPGVFVVALLEVIAKAGSDAGNGNISFCHCHPSLDDADYIYKVLGAARFPGGEIRVTFMLASTLYARNISTDGLRNNENQCIF